MKTKGCHHKWVYDHDQSDHYAYNPLNDYEPPKSVYTCTKCGMKKVTYESGELLWSKLLRITLGPILLILFAIIYPIILVVSLIISWIKDAKATKLAIKR
jgi:hypothetical protein